MISLIEQEKQSSSERSSASAEILRGSSGSLQLVFKGVILNQSEISGQLGIESKIGLPEFLLTAWAKLGERLVDEINGSFALVVSDSEEERIWAARDIFGFIPLYYREPVDKDFADLPEFSFDAESLSGGLGFESLNLDHLAEYLSGHLVSQGSSEFRGVSRLKAGELVSWKGGRKSSKPLWKIPQVDENCNYAEACQRLNESFSESLERSYRGREQIAVSLSGGQDSGCLYSLSLEKHSSSKLFSTYHLSFSGFECDESERVSLLSETLRAPESVKIREANLDGLEFIKRELSLFSGFPNYPTGLLVGQVKALVREDGFDSLAVGYGADELFTYFSEGSIGSLSARNVLSFLLPGFIKDGLKRAGLGNDWTPPWFTVKFNSDTGIENALRQTEENPYPVQSFQYRKYKNLFDPAAIRMRELEGRDAEHFGIELLCPYLDKSFVETCFSIPESCFWGADAAPNLGDKPLALDSLGKSLPEKYLTDPSRVDFSPVALKILETVVGEGKEFSGPLLDLGWVEPKEYMKCLQLTLKGEKSSKARFSFWELWSTWAANEYLKRF